MSPSTATAARVPTRPIARPVGRERPQPRLRVVAPAPRRSAGGLALLSVGLLVLGLLVLLLLNISIGKGAYALTELQRQQRQLAESQQSLAEQVDAASAPAKLAAQATRLGMVPNPNPAFVKVPDGTVQGEAEVAQAPVKPAGQARETARRAVGAAAAAAEVGKRALEKQKAKQSTVAAAGSSTAANTAGQTPAVEPTP